MIVQTISPITDLCVDFLEAIDGDHLVGRGQQPKGSGWQGDLGNSPFVAYVTLHRVGGDLDGSIAEPLEDLELVYQPTCTGATEAQCELLNDKVREAMADLTNWVTDGRYATLVSVDLLDLRRDDTVEPSVFMSRDRFRVFLTTGS